VLTALGAHAAGFAVARRCLRFLVYIIFPNGSVSRFMKTYRPTDNLI